MKIRSVPVNHLVPAASHPARGIRDGLAVSGNSTTNEFWKAVNATEDCKHAIIGISLHDADKG